MDADMMDADIEALAIDHENPESLTKALSLLQDARAEIARLLTVQPGEVEELRDIVHYVAYPEARISSDVPFGGDDGEWATSLCRKYGITRPTTNEKETT